MLFVNNPNTPLPAWVSICELAEMWHVPPWELEAADERGELNIWAVRAFLWRSTKNKRDEILNAPPPSPTRF